MGLPGMMPYGSHSLHEYQDPYHDQDGTIAEQVVGERHSKRQF